ncbi:hypothetical protein [Chishuiella changwenlii]|uniref:hypothetical protein n=1 Tax=Chishuiella changwenlii TaxID=1434701 RepID=UPI002FD9609A
MILKKHIVKKLAQKLSLNYSDTQQDWDLEMSDLNKIDDFIEFYNSNDLDFEERKIVIALIVASYNEYLYQNEKDSRWEIISDILKTERKILKELCNYWLVDDNIDEDSFPITRLLQIQNY